MRILGLTAMLALVALAGCLGGDDEPADDHLGDCPEAMDSHDAMDSNEPEGNESVLALRSLQPGNETGNETGPEAQSGESETMDDGHDDCSDDGMAGIGAGAYLASDVASGEAPLDVLLDFGVTEITMDEFLTWTLDVNGDGVFESEGNGNNLVEGGNFTFTYTEAGVWNATFEATDGIDSWNATIAITVTAAEDQPVDDDLPIPEPEAGGPYPQVLTFTVAQNSPVFYVGGPALCVGFLTGQSDLDCAWAELDAAWVGKSYKSESDGDVDLGFAEDCTALSAPGSSVNGATGHDSGTIPDGMSCIVVAEFSGSGEITVTIG